jgi:ubiquinone biosynthesis protein Coq4
MLNTLFFHPELSDERLDAIARGWAMGKRAARLVGIDWAKMLPLPLAEVRVALRLEVATRDFTGRVAPLAA